MAQIANVFACRSGRLSAFRVGWLTNPLIYWGIAVELTLFAVISYTSIGNQMFGTTPLPLWVFGPLIIGAMLLLLAEEARKLIANRLSSRSSPKLLQPELS